MNYWILSPNVLNDSTELDWKKVIPDLKYAFIGYNTDHRFGVLFKTGIKIGDIILIAQGQNSSKRFFFCGIVSTNAIWEHKVGTPGFAQNRELKYVLNKEVIDNLKLDFIDSTYGASRQPATLYKLKTNNVAKDKIISEKLLNAIELIKDTETMQQKIDVLKYKKQIILQGPPGTGKTRMAKKLAFELTKSEVKLSPLEPISSNRIISVASGAINLTSKSASQVCSIFKIIFTSVITAF